MVEVLPPLAWAQRHFGPVQLGDKRRTDRVVKYAAAAARSPSASIPQQCGGAWNQTKGAYRLFDNKQISLPKLQEPHCRQTLEAARGRKVVLWVNDTTTLSFAHPATAGLGPVSAAGGSGMLLHTTMAVDVSGGVEQPALVMGLGHQELWIRPGKPADQSLESGKWPVGINAVGTPPAGVRWVHVGDCESDCWEALQSCREQGVGFALRACQNRQVLAGHLPAGQVPTEPPTLLFDLLAKQPSLGNKKLWVRGRKDRKARWATLEVSATPLTLLAPKNWSDKPHRKDMPRPAPLCCWAVRVYEVNGPADEEPIEWVILTDEPASDLTTALKVVFWALRESC